MDLLVITSRLPAEKSADGAEHVLQRAFPFPTITAEMKAQTPEALKLVLDTIGEWYQALKEVEKTKQVSGTIGEQVLNFKSPANPLPGEVMNPGSILELLARAFPLPSNVDMREALLKAHGKQEEKTKAVRSKALDTSKLG